MPRLKPEKPTFNSWKEIARFLDVDVRTCQRWEKKFQLPVRRFDDCVKSRVFAYRDELNIWLEKKLIKGETRPGVQKPSFSIRLMKRWWLAPVLILSAFMLMIFFRFDRTSTLPDDFSIRKSELVITNRTGQELWRFDTGCPGLFSHNQYRFSFQVKRLNEKRMVSLPLIQIQDTDGDRLPEVLFARRTCNLNQSGTFFIFDYRGRTIAAVNTGREMRFGDVTYSGDFYIYGFDTSDLDGDGRREILLVANQNPFFPTRFMILDERGNLKGEYWNSGRISDVAVADLDQDGRQEILISGMNNEYRKGFLAVFDSGNVSGGSPQFNEKYRGEGLKPGSQLTYILFPRTDLDLLEHLLDNCTEIRILKNHDISARSHHTKNIFLFDRQLNLKNILFSNDFAFRHQQAVREKKLSSTLDQDYKNRLKANLLYFDGRSWATR